MRLGNCPTCKAKMIGVNYPQKDSVAWRRLVHCSKATVHTFTDDDPILATLDVERIKKMQKEPVGQICH